MQGQSIQRHLQHNRRRHSEYDENAVNQRLQRTNATRWKQKHDRSSGRTTDRAYEAESLVSRFFLFKKSRFQASKTHDEHATSLADWNLPPPRTHKRRAREQWRRIRHE